MEMILEIGKMYPYHHNKFQETNVSLTIANKKSNQSKINQHEKINFMYWNGNVYHE